jgi:hypothetical protein
MSETITVIVISVLLFLAYLAGADAGRNNLCKEMNTEYHNNKCVVVERRELRLNDRNK